MNWKFWQSSPPPAKPEPIVGPIIIIKGLMNGGTVNVETLWPVPQSAEHGAAIAKELASLIFYISVGNMYNTMLQSASIFGNQSGMNGIATQAVEMAQRAWLDKNIRENDALLVVEPEETFGKPDSGN